MKKYTQVLKFSMVAVLLAFLLSSCHFNQKVKIGFLLSSLQDDRYKKEKALFIDHLREQGGEPIVYSAELDDKLQITQAEQCIAQGAKVLVVNSVNLNTAAAIVRTAHENGVKVIAYDRMIFNCDLDYYVSFSGEKIGQLMASYATKVKQDGNYILLGGDKADLNASLVKNGQLSVLNPLINSGKIKIVLNVFVEDWSAVNAYKQIKRYIDLTGENPDAILASNDGMASGAIDALKEYNLAGSVIVTGQDAQLQSCRDIVQGYQTMTIYKSSKSLVFKAIELAIKISKNDKITDANSTINNGFKEVPSILLEPVSVDKNNIKSTVVADGYLKEDEIYK